MPCNDLLTAGIDFNCDESFNGVHGLGKDLILVNWDDYSKSETFDPANEDTTPGPNEGGLMGIKLTTGAEQYIFEGLNETSITPNVTSEVRDDGTSRFVHTVVFKVYNKLPKARNVLTELANSKVIAIARDNSTGLYELFGGEIGLRISEISREYYGEEDSNYFTVTLVTPDIAVVREPQPPKMANEIDATATTLVNFAAEPMQNFEGEDLTSKE